MNGQEIVRIRYAIPRDLQPEGARLPTVDTVPIDLQHVIPVCFACHHDYLLPSDPRIIGLTLNGSYIDWETAISQFLNHQDRHSESSHGKIIDRVDHSILLYNAGVVFQRNPQ